MTVIAWEGTGASVLSLTWRRDRGGSVQGFPWGYYGPCALDERCKPSAGADANAGIVSCGEAERTGTEIAGGRGMPRHCLLTQARQTAPASRPQPRGQFFDNGQTDDNPGVARMKCADFPPPRGG